MTALNRTPNNTNFFQSNKFLLTFLRAPAMQYFCQSVNLPGVSLSEIPQSTPFVDIFRPGEKIIYDVLNVTFLVDEDLISWFEIHDWIRALTFPTKFDEYKNLGQLSPNAVNTSNPQYSDASLTLLNSKNNPTYRIKFLDCFPTTLSSIMMSTTDDANAVITADVSFRFTVFNIDKL